MNARDDRETWDSEEQPDRLEPCVGNPAYEAHIERVVSAAVGPDKFSYLQTNLAIIVDRDQRAHEGHSKPRAVTSAEELDALPLYSIVTRNSVPYTKTARGWQLAGVLHVYTAASLLLNNNATVLHEPGTRP